MMSRSDCRVLGVIGLGAMIALTAGAAASACRGTPEVPSLIGSGIASRSWDVTLHDARTIDVNRADASELERLPGVGPALAARIVDERRHRGRFAAPEDLLRVRGIGRKTLEALREYLTFDSR